MRFLVPPLSRREFLGQSARIAAGLAIPFVLPGALESALAQAAQPPAGRAPDLPILILLELAGGNDGLNTVAPVAEDAYHRARPRIALKPDQVLSLNDHIGLHPKLAGLKSLYDKGRLAIVLGAGYPNPNRSHFRSMEIWRTASDADRSLTQGWMGRWLDAASASTPDALLGVAIGPQFPQTFCGDKGLGVAFQEPEQFRWRDGAAGNTDAAFRSLNKTSSAQAHEDTTLGFLRHITENLALSSDRVLAAARSGKHDADYPANKLARDLRAVSVLIKGGLPTRVYSVSYGGFDTHANQLPTHERLLEGLGASLEAFLKDIEAAGLADRILIVAFSEFGRRVQENASGGTDHGAAGPMFIVSNRLKPGLYGRYPSLAELDEGDLRFSVDFRSVYATVLERWLRTDSKAILGRAFPTLDFLAG